MELGIILLVVVLLVVFITGFFLRIKNQERIRLIDKGINPDEGRNITELRRMETLKNGIIFISFAIGLLMGHVLETYIGDFDKFVAYASMILLFGGIGFLVNYFITRNRDTRN